MNFTLTGVSSGNTGVAIVASASHDAVDTPRFLTLEMIMDTIALGPGMWVFESESQTQTQSEIEFRDQESKFNEIPPLLLEQYRGRFVASRNSRIVDSDVDFVTLVHRFFKTFGDVPVYMTKIGDDDCIMIDTPFFD